MNIFIKANSLIVYTIEILLYVVIYCLSMWKIGMNEYEKKLLITLLTKIFRLGRK